MNRSVPVLQILDHFNISPALEGDEAKFCCPFHEERTPSCGFEMSTGRWYCFGCGEGGGLIQFVEHMLKATGQVNGVGVGLQALRLIKQLRAMPIAERDEDDEPRVRTAGVLPYDLEEAWARFHAVNWTTISEKHSAAAYLLGRGLLRETLDAFQVRLSERDGYPIVIPIRMGDALVGYVYRRIDTADEKKYRYNFGLSAGSVLGYYRVSDAPLITVEGMLDLMLVAQYGGEHAAALLSWRVSSVQAAWLQAYGVREVVSALDNTPTGRRGTRRLRQYFTVRRFKFPGTHTKDVGDLSRHEFVKGLHDSEER